MGNLSIGERFRKAEYIGTLSPVGLTEQETEHLRECGPYDLLRAVRSAWDEANLPMLGYLGLFAMAREVEDVDYIEEQTFEVVWKIADNYLAELVDQPNPWGAPTPEYPTA